METLVSTPQKKQKELLLTDPAIENGLPDYEIYCRYGSAALPTHLPSADKIWLSRPWNRFRGYSGQAGPGVSLLRNNQSRRIRFKTRSKTAKDNRSIQKSTKPGPMFLSFRVDGVGCPCPGSLWNIDAANCSELCFYFLAEYGIRYYNGWINI